MAGGSAGAGSFTLRKDERQLQRLPVSYLK
jgi:hypothetical protein